MTPSQIETYHGEETDIALEVHHFDDGRESTYWVRSGITAIQCRQDELIELAELLKSYKEEELEMRLSKPVKRTVAALFLSTIIALMIGVLIYV